MKTSPPEADPIRSEGKAIPPSGFAIGIFQTIWVVGWTIATLILDLAVAVKFEESDDAVFLLLFSIPFNAVLIMVLCGIGLRVVLPWKTYRLLGMGIRVLDQGHEVRIRLPRVTPIGAAFLAAFVVPIVLVVGFTNLTLSIPSSIVAAGGIALTLAGIVGAYVVASRGIAAGKSDVIIDRLRSTMTLPTTFGRSEAVTVALHELGGIIVFAREKKDSDGSTWVYAVAAQWLDRSGGSKQETLIEQTFQDTAEDVAVMIRDALRTCSHDRELSTEPSVGIHAGNIYAARAEMDDVDSFRNL